MAGARKIGSGIGGLGAGAARSRARKNPEIQRIGPFSVFLVFSRG
jgi:hypothetical protein